MLASADYGTIEAVSQRLIEASDALTSMVGRIAAARQTREYHNDRAKRALSIAVRDAITVKPELSMSAAEHIARASDGYGEAMKKLGGDLLAAEQTVAEWDAAKTKFEAARSLLSVQKTIAGQF